MYSRRTARNSPQRVSSCILLRFTLCLNCIATIWCNWPMVLAPNFRCVFTYLDLKLFAGFCKFTKICKGLWHRNTELFSFLTFRCAKQFYVPNMQEQSKVGKISEINRQTFVNWWLNSRRYRSVWYLLSCMYIFFSVQAFQFRPCFLLMITIDHFNKRTKSNLFQKNSFRPHWT